MRSMRSDARSTRADQIVIGTTLILAVGIPAHLHFALGEPWVGALPPVVRLVLTSPVVLAVLLGVGLHAVLNLALGGGEAPEF